MKDPSFVSWLLHHQDGRSFTPWLPNKLAARDEVGAADVKGVLLC